MPEDARRPAQAAIRTELRAIFVSLELSRRTWLITSLSPGGGEKMSKHSVPASDVAGLARAIAGPRREHRREGLEELRTGDGRPLPLRLKAQIIRELDRLELLLEQLKTVEAERDTLLKPMPGETASPAAMLARLKGIGPQTAAVLWSEGLFRQFDNRRQVAAYAGLAPTPWQSGSIDHEQGVSKAGNPPLRTTMVELAWLWLHNQPTSTRRLWFHRLARCLRG